VLRTLCDELLELRAGFGAGIVTALARIEGQTLGVIANNPAHLGGAIDAPAADKAARFMQLCDAYDVPILMLTGFGEQMTTSDTIPDGVTKLVNKPVTMEDLRSAIAAIFQDSKMSQRRD